jgi:hypothetical protein
MKKVDKTSNRLHALYIQVGVKNKRNNVNPGLLTHPRLIRRVMTLTLALTDQGRNFFRGQWRDIYTSHESL